jgi:hypothetical protein
MRRGRKSSWEEEQWNVVQEKGGNEGSKNRDKKIVMVKLIIQKKIQKNTKYSNDKKFSLLGKSSGVIPLVSSPGIGAWYSGLCGKGFCPSCQTAWGRDGWRIFFLLSLVLWAFHYKLEL